MAATTQARATAKVIGPRSDPGGTEDDADRQRLEELLPSAQLSVELPFQGNGHMYQVTNEFGMIES